MRLSSDEIAAIRDCARAHFGEHAVVRLFGSRLRDEFDGGDIDLHVTTADRAAPAATKDFRSALEHRLAKDVDLHVVAAAERRRPIDEIAILTGQVLAGTPILLGPELDPATRVRMEHEAYRKLLIEAVASGRQSRAKLADLFGELGAKFPLDETSTRSLSRYEQLLVDSLLLQYGNLVATVQDQLIRGILLAQEGKLPSRNREDQRLRLLTLGILPADIDFRAIASARNNVAHNYPADPAKQAIAVNEVVSAVPIATRAFEVLARHVDIQGWLAPRQP